MKKIYSIILLLSFTIGFSQAGAPSNPYYNGFDWTQTGTTLKTDLASKITNTHSNILTYAEAERAIKIVDLDPNDLTNTQVLLLYGYDNTNYCNYVSESNFGTSTNWNQHRRRHKEADVSGGSQCAWNREHVYAQSLGTPILGQTGAGADAHHLRACDVDRNANRGSSKFGPGSGNSAYFGSFWYPGDEWKGDVARNMMYLYLRYPSQCKPTGVGSGATVTNDTDMIQLFLQWNAEDPVSQYEDNRNTYLGNASNTYGQGNRNPFIDNPYLATKIWGGIAAENRWPTTILANEYFDNIFTNLVVYPNPSNENKINIQSDVAIQEINLININGQLMQVIQKPIFENNVLTLEYIPQGFYFLKITSSENQVVTKKIIIN